MTAAPSARNYSLEEYLDLEKAMVPPGATRIKYEYLRGTIYAMAGGTPEHAALASNIGTVVGLRLSGKPCTTYSSDLQLAAFDADFYTYADASIVCGDRVYHPRSSTHVLNPTVVIEVLSDSTEGYDRGEKRELYQRMPSLREYVLIAQDRRSIEAYARNEGGTEWVYTCHRGGETVSLPSIGVTFPVDELYERARVNVP